MGTGTNQRGQALRGIPSTDAFLRSEGLRELPRPVAVRASRAYLDEIRERVRVGELDKVAVDALFGGGASDDSAAVRDVLARALASMAPHHRRVINATGIVLHTGLGRAPLAPAARDAAAQAAGYAVVELDPETGERNEREAAVAALLADITGASGALVVNNNAAAITLLLAAMARGREVVVSRGQLVEIGGGFRMPEVMAQAGCHMVEVGATNRTHLSDYARAISDDTAALLLVHPSNFLVLGFTGQPTRAEIVRLAKEHELRVIDDLGSGFLLRAPLPGLEREPYVGEVVESGVDLTCFSGDKLLGGPQCGIVLGEKDLVAQVRRHPLYRAFRCDKLTLAALEATLRIYRDGDPVAEIPTLRQLAAPADRLKARAEQLAEALSDLSARVVPSESFAGSGANPARPLPSFAVALPGGDRVAAALRAPGEWPSVFARIDDGEVLLDARTLELEDLDEVQRVVRTRLQP